MTTRTGWGAAMTSVLVIVAACSPAGPTVSDPAIAVTRASDGIATIDVTGLSDVILDALERSTLSPEQWAAVLRVSVDASAAPMLGTYVVANQALRFTPRFPLDEGRDYLVQFDVGALPGVGTGAGSLVEATVGLPRLMTEPSTRVAQVYPSGDAVPENLLRMYIEFSGPMGRRSGVEFLTLLDDEGNEIAGAFLPLDYEFWSPDHKRFTAFFDPGRVKLGILPNQEMGRALSPGRSVTLVIASEWRDEHGLPLTEEFRRTYVVGPSDDVPLDPERWDVQPPISGGRDALVVRFPDPIDQGLAMRAIGVRWNGLPMGGDVALDEAETRWTFTPAVDWQSGPYELIALDTLEDAAGNQIGRAFEVDTFDTVDENLVPETVVIPFTVP